MTPGVPGSSPPVPPAPEVKYESKRILQPKSRQSCKSCPFICRSFPLFFGRKKIPRPISPSKLQSFAFVCTRNCSSSSEHRDIGGHSSLRTQAPSPKPLRNSTTIQPAIQLFNRAGAIKNADNSRNSGKFNHALFFLNFQPSHPPLAPSSPRPLHSFSACLHQKICVEEFTRPGGRHLRTICVRWRSFAPRNVFDASSAPRGLRPLAQGWSPQRPTLGWIS